MRQKKSLTLSIVASCLLVVATQGSAQFEGVVVTKNVTRDEMGKPLEFVMTMWIQNDKAKVTHGAIGSTPASTMIYRADKNVVWILDEQHKTYSSMVQEPAGDDESMPRQSKGITGHSIKKTGKSKKILGYPAEQVVIRHGGLKTEIWGTRKLKDLAEVMDRVFGQQGSLAGEGWTSELMRMGLYPLSSSTLLNGKIAESQVVTQIELRTLPQEIFEIPEMYKEQRPDEMINQIPDPKKE